MRIVYYSPYYSNTRDQIIRRSKNILKQGKKVVYIIPSDEATFYVKKGFAQIDGNFRGLNILTLDSFERLLCKETTNMNLLEEFEAEFLLRTLISEANKNNVYDKVREKAGFVILVQQLIRRLKELDINFTELIAKTAAAEPSLRGKCEFIAEVFEKYEKYKQEHNLYDAGDFPHLAPNVLEYTSFLKNTGLIVLDGFIQIDPVHIKVLDRILKLYGDTGIIVNVPYKNIHNSEFIENGLIPVFEKLGFTIEKSNTETLEIPNPCLKTLSVSLYSGRHVFDSKTEGITIFGSPTVETEVRETARTIKNLLMNENKDAEPDEIAVFINDIEMYRDTLIDVFDEAGIPLHIHGEISLVNVPLAKDILSLVMYSIDEFTEESRENILYSRYFSDKKYEIESLYRKADTPAEYLNMIKELLVYLDVENNLLLLKETGSISNEDFLRDSKALEQVKKIIDRTLKLFSEFPYRMTGGFLPTVYNELFNAFAECKISVKHHDTGCIKVLSPEEACGQLYRYVFVLGVNEGIFPKEYKAPSLFDAVEEEFLFSQGINNYNRGWELERQKTRFNMCLASAAEKVYMSYTTSDEKGSVMIKSPFLDEVEALMNSEALSSAMKAACYLRDRFTGNDLPISCAEALNIAVNNVWQLGRTDFIITGICGEYLKNESFAGNLDYINHSGKVEYSRYKSPRFDNYDGLLSDPEIAQKDACYGFSPSQVNTYVRCPFCYYMDRVLKILDIDEESRERMDLGKFYHAVLEEYYRDNDSWDTFDEDRLAEIFKKHTYSMPENGMPQVVTEQRKRELYINLKNFLISDAEVFEHYYQKTGLRLKPSLFEHKFHTEFFDSSIISGTVDRVDFEIDKEGTFTGRFVIYDYKKSGIKKLRDCAEGSDYQLPVYYKAVSKLVREQYGIDKPECLALIYASVEKLERNGIIRSDAKSSLFRGNRGPRDLVTAGNFEVLMEWVESKGTELIERIRKGDFTVPYPCPVENTPFGCSYKSVCRYDRYRILPKMVTGGRTDG